MVVVEPSGDGGRTAGWNGLLLVIKGEDDDGSPSLPTALDPSCDDVDTPLVWMSNSDDGM